MMVAGIGCRSGVTAEQVDAALEAALRQTAVVGVRLRLIATPVAKGGEAGIIAAAGARKIPLVLITQTDLEAANPRTLTRSAHSLQVMNVDSVSEAAALAGAGAGSQLLGPRIAVGPVTCALASARAAEAEAGAEAPNSEADARTRAADPLAQAHGADPIARSREAKTPSAGDDSQ